MVQNPVEMNNEKMKEKTTYETRPVRELITARQFFLDVLKVTLRFQPPLKQIKTMGVNITNIAEP